MAATSPSEPIEGILFDLDGTIIDSARDIAAATNVALTSIGRAPLPEPEIRGYIGDGIRQLLMRCLGGEDPRLDEAIARYREHYTEHALDHTRLYPGIAELLEALSDRRLAVVSNKLEGFCRSMLEGLGVEHHFDVVTGGDTTSEQKPSPRPLLHTLERLGVPSERAVVVGDGPQDLAAARAAGLRSCAVLWGFTPRARLLAEEPTHVAASIEELVDWLGVR